MKSIVQWFLVLLLIMMLYGCGNGETKTSIREDSFENTYSDCEMNSTIQFLPPQQDEFRLGSLISLSITNTSKDAVIFPIDFNVKILYFDSRGQQWLEIKDILQHIPYTDPFRILKPAGSGLESYSVVTIKSGLLNAVITEARVVITGNFFIDNEKMNECVGAFVDIKISP